MHKRKYAFLTFPVSSLAMYAQASKVKTQIRKSSSSSHSFARHIAHSLTLRATANYAKIYHARCTHLACYYRSTCNFFVIYFIFFFYFFYFFFFFYYRSLCIIDDGASRRRTRISRFRARRADHSTT